MLKKLKHYADLGFFAASCLLKVALSATVYVILAVFLLIGITFLMGVMI